MLIDKPIYRMSFVGHNVIFCQVFFVHCKLVYTVTEKKPLKSFKN